MLSRLVWGGMLSPEAGWRSKKRRRPTLREQAHEPLRRMQQDGGERGACQAMGQVEGKAADEVADRISRPADEHMGNRAQEAEAQTVAARAG